MRPQDEVRVAPIVIAGMIGAILTFAMIVGVSALFLKEQNRAIYDKQVSRSPQELHLIQSDQLEKLSEYRYLDEKKGIVRIPIERAMALIVKEHASGKSGSDK